jgi:RNA polymerase sigma-70 factor (ECF subfamily)
MLDVLAGIEGTILSKIRSVQSKLDVEDVLQYAAIAIMQGYEQAPRTKAVWIAQSARRSAWRSARRDHVFFEDSSKKFDDSDPLAALIQCEELEALQSAFEKIEPQYAEVLKMRFYEGMTFEEIAEALGVRRNTAARRVRNALEQLKGLIYDL